MERLVICVGILVFIVGVGIAVFISLNPTPDAVLITWSILLCAIALGFLSGAYISPDNDEMRKRFDNSLKSIATFVSGFSISEIKNIPQSDINLVRIFLFIGLFGAVLFVTFLARTYLWKKYPTS